MYSYNKIIKLFEIFILANILLSQSLDLLITDSIIWLSTDALKKWFLIVAIIQIILVLIILLSKKIEENKKILTDISCYFFVESVFFISWMISFILTYEIFTGFKSLNHLLYILYAVFGASYATYLSIKIIAISLIPKKKLIKNFES